MVNTRMFVFKHPKYYKELRTRNKSDQAISDSVDPASGVDSVRPGQGHKQQASTKLVNACIDQKEPQAPSAKQQAPSAKLQKNI